MNEIDNKNSRKDFLFIIVFLFLILTVIIFNYITDPYYILRDTTIKGFNNVKTHKYSNRRTIIYSDIKLNRKNKDIAFTGNCLLSHYGSGLDNVAFFTIPVAKVEEVVKIIENIHKLSPDIKKIYWGLFYDDFRHDPEEVHDSLPDYGSDFFNFQDFINLFFSYNTTKFSLDTVKDSVKNKGKDFIYIYPYREIAKKKYDDDFNFESLEKLKYIKDFANKNNIELVIYYSPIHITKKVHLYEKGMWESNLELKRRIAQITPFYDYSLVNKYNTSPLDQNNFNFVDNIHPTNVYNNLIVNDLLSPNKEIGILLNTDNIEKYLTEDTAQLQDYMNINKDITEKIKNVKADDAEIKIRRKDAV